MEIIRIKHRDFVKENEINGHSFICSYKEKQYFIRKFDYKTNEGKELIYCLKQLKLSGVKVPKLFWVDKKAGYIVTEFIDGELASNYFSKQDFEEWVYEKLFISASYAKMNKMTLDYSPDKWMIKDGELYYIYPIYIRYKKEKDLVEKYIRLWFNTKETASFMKENRLSFDSGRIKKEYEVNKQIVLMTCKYYR